MKSSSMPISVSLSGRRRDVFSDEASLGSPGSPDNIGGWTSPSPWCRLAGATLFISAALGSLCLLNLAISVAAINSTKELTVSGDGSLVSFKDPNTMVSTMSTGKIFELDLIMDREKFSRAFSCVDLEVASSMWSSVKYGVHTNVVLSVMPDSSTAQEFGVSLTFQGATKNSTHACISTLEQDHKLCMDFVSDRCEGSATVFQNYPVLHSMKEEEDEGDYDKDDVNGDDDDKEEEEEDDDDDDWLLVTEEDDQVADDDKDDDNGDDEEEEDDDWLLVTEEYDQVADDDKATGEVNNRRFLKGKSPKCKVYGELGCFIRKKLSIVLIGV